LAKYETLLNKKTSRTKKEKVQPEQQHEEQQGEEHEQQHVTEPGQGQ
jgi:hypothetical protein